MRFTTKVLLTLAAVTAIVPADTVLQSFNVWAANKTYQEKASLYHGWRNGYLQGLRQHANPEQMKRVVEFATCMEKYPYREAVALIDKFYKDHPETRQQPLPDTILVALTVKGTPCHGKAPE